MPLTPKNRKEEWLQGLVDHETTLTPKNRKEQWMKEIIDSSGGGGGGGGVLVVEVTFDYDNHTVTCDKTASEMITAFKNGSLIGAYMGDPFNEYAVFTGAYEYLDGAYVFFIYINGNTIGLSAATGNDYPSDTLE